MRPMPSSGGSSCSTARRATAIAQAREANGSYAGRLPAIVAGARRSFDVLDFRTDTGSAGIGIDATEAETMRSALARMVDAHRRTLDQLPTGVAMFDADQRLTFHNAAYRALWDLDAGYLDQGPTDSAVIEELRAARKLPEAAGFPAWKAQLSKPIASLEAKSTPGTCRTGAPCASSPRPIRTAASLICSTT